MNNLTNLEAIVSENYGFSLLIVFIVGVITSFSPCSIGTMTVLGTYIGTDEEKSFKKSLKNSGFFVIGMSITFMVIGLITIYTATFFRSSLSDLFNVIMSVILILMALSIMGVINIHSLTCRIPKRREGNFGAFILGLVGGLVCTPCSGPLIVSLVALVSVLYDVEGLVKSIGFLLVFSLGHSVLIVIGGMFTVSVGKLLQSEKVQKVQGVAKVTIGIFLLLLGIYFFYVSIF